MKKIIFLLVAGIGLPASGYCQDTGQADERALPFSRLTTMTPAELTSARFRYEMEKNRYIMQKGDFWGTMEERPKRKNYKIMVQYGKKGPAYVRVEFTNPEAYHEIMDYLIKAGVDYQETVSTRMVKISFERDGLKCSLTRVPKYKATTYSSDNGVYSSSRDISHENFTMVLDTGNEPDSGWHQRRREREERRAKRNARPRSIMEFM